MSHHAGPAGRLAPWFRDFGWSDGRLQIRKTGVRLRVDRALVGEILLWIPYLARLGVAAAVARAGRSRRVAVWYEPDTPRGWYLMRGAALWAGLALAQSREEADAAFYFEDTTTGEPPTPPCSRAFNYACTDISKSRVAAVFEQVFGYPLNVDPRRHDGPMVEKPEKNGVHAGRIYHRGEPVLRGHVYQRLVDTEDAGGHVTDLRTLVAGGRPLFVWIKQKAAGSRFPIHSLRTTLAEPDDVFSAEELGLIADFAARMGLDWGGLDILRDRTSGRIYVVDVNKTDLGPVISLSWRDKVRSLRRLATAMDALVCGAHAEDAGPAVYPARAA